jgi:hypothetical protein
MSTKDDLIVISCFVLIIVLIYIKVKYASVKGK